MIPIGNKKDLAFLREVPGHLAQEYVAKISLIHNYIETSAKTGENVDMAFQMLGEATEALNEPFNLP